MSGSLQPAQTATATISQGQASVTPVSVGYYPAEGSRCVTAQYNWTTTTGYAEDMSGLVARGVETTIQSVFIDNSTNASSVTLTMAGSGQVVVCPAQSQGTFPLFLTGAPGFQITCPATSATVTRCCFLNVPLSGFVWHV